MRDDSILYTGVTSATNKPTARQIQVEEKEQAQPKLKPAAAVVLELLDKERQNVLDLRSLVIDRTTPEQEVNTELLARKLYLDYLNSLENKVKSIMAVRPQRKPKEAESE